MSYINMYLRMRFPVQLLEFSLFEQYFLENYQMYQQTSVNNNFEI